MRTPLYSLRIGSGAIRIRRDLAEYRIIDEGWFISFDESNPPEVAPNTVIAMIPRFTNEGLSAVDYTLEGSVTDPDGTQVPFEWYLDPSHPRRIDPGATGGIGIEFTAATPGNYTLAYRVYADGVLSDSWQPVVCRVSESSPEEPSQETPDEEEPTAEATHRIWPLVTAGTLALAGIGAWFWWRR